MEISKDTKLCEAYMGKYPVISISLKGINAAAYEDAFDFAVQIMQRTAEEFQFLSDSEYLSEHDKSVYRELLDSNMSETVFCGGLKILSKLLEKHYRLKGFLLIDEYDFPAGKQSFNLTLGFKIVGHLNKFLDGIITAGVDPIVFRKHIYIVLKFIQM